MAQSVFCDDDGAKSHFSLTDEEDEEEYRPQHLDSNDDEDYDDDDDDDDGLIKVARRELEDLVDGCWQTVAGEPLQYGPSDCEVSGSQKSRGLKRSRCSFIDASSLSGQESTGTGENSLSHIAGKSSSRPSKLPFPHPNRLNPPPNRVQGQQSGGQSLISNLVRQIFSGEKPSAVCLDGMPVDAIRKLVARQMSMASQLLVQMLLSSEDRSGCFSSCYTSLMELSNQREQALKKAALLQMNMKNLKVAALQKIALLSQQPCLSLDSSPAEMRLTRQWLSGKVKRKDRPYAVYPCLMYPCWLISLSYLGRLTYRKGRSKHRLLYYLLPLLLFLLTFLALTKQHH